MGIIFEVLSIRELAKNVKEIDIYAPRIACSVKPGQFVIVMSCRECERIPLSVADWNCREGWIRIVFLEIGVSTYKLGEKKCGDSLYHVAGPLGNSTHIDKLGTIAIVAGGVAIAAAYPVAKAFKEAGNKVVSFIGAKSVSLLIYKNKIESVSDEIHIATDDGSYGFKGFVTQLLETQFEKGFKPDLVWVIGPALMMKNCSEIVKKWGVKSVASLNPIMVCGMGMCGACRIKVKDKVKFTCIDGPEFNATDVDWDELIQRLSTYSNEEKYALNLYIENKR